MFEFGRIKRLPPYVFAIVNNLKMEARRQGADIIDLGMGNPDLPAPKHIVDKLCEAANNPKNHRYSASKGITQLRMAITERYKRMYDVDLDPEHEAVVTIGSKEGLTSLSQRSSPATSSSREPRLSNPSLQRDRRGGRGSVRPYRAGHRLFRGDREGL